MELTRLADLRGSERSRLFEGGTHGSTVSFFWISYPEPGLGPGLHRHPYDETWLMLEGRALLEIAGEQREVGEGDIAVAPARAPHTFTSLTALRVLCIHANPELVQEELE
jgi:mannose-6-phosphate isomerase-like protein (cupin superfamily)